MEMLVNRATGLVRQPQARPVRHGKTAKDRANGNAQRNHERKMERAAWQNSLAVKQASERGVETPRFPN